jgi:hypothetical protein
VLRLPRDHPAVLRRAVDGIDLLADLRELELEPGDAKGPLVRIGVDAREEHRDAEPLLDPVLRLDREERRHQPTTRTQPIEDPGERRSDLLAGHVVEREEGDDRVERCATEGHRREVTHDERRLRDAPSSDRELNAREVEADVRSAAREHCRIGAGSAAGLHDTGAFGQSRDDLAEEPRSHVGRTSVVPDRERWAHAIVSLGDHALGIGHARIVGPRPTSAASDPS